MGQDELLDAKSVPMRTATAARHGNPLRLLSFDPSV